MDYTPISARRVVVAFAITMVVALLPAVWLLVGASDAGSSSLIGSVRHGAASTLVAAGAVLAVVMVTALVMLLMGRRMVRRPTSA